jgi:hypothetical protein
MHVDFQVNNHTKAVKDVPYEFENKWGKVLYDKEV